MKLKPVLDTVDGLSDEVKALYERRSDGKFYLDLDGLPPGVVERSKLDEFRTNNIELLRKIDEMTTRFKDVDPDKYRQIMDEQQKVKDKQLIDAGKIDELVEQRVQRMRTDHESQVTALNKANSDLQEAFNDVFGRYSNTLLMAELTRAVDNVGKVRKGALEDIISRARGVWSLNDDGDLQALDGEKPMYGRDGKAPLTMAEWLGGLAEMAPHLFEGSSGGGGSGNNGGGGGGGVRQIQPGDNRAFISNLEGIAKGTVAVGNG